MNLSSKLALLCLCCFHFSQLNAAVWYVNISGTGNGTSWSNASSDLQGILAVANTGDQVWVAKGTYFVAECNPCNQTHREESFKLHSGVKLFGGFAGNESELTQRDPNSNLTILDGDIGIPNDRADNSYTILEIGTAELGTVVDGFVFQNGNANEGIADNLGPKNSGGAIHIKASGQGNFSEPSIYNCIFKNNRAHAYGGAINIFAGFGGHGKMHLYNCEFISNFANVAGGAVYEYSAFSGQVEGDIEKCTFRLNASEEGGALFILSSKEGFANINVSKSTFEYNWSKSTGGAVSNYASNGSSTSSFDECYFHYNEGKRGGAVNNDGTYDGSCLTTFSNCIFLGNSALNGGAGIYNNGYQGISEPLIDNCLFQENFTPKSGGAIYNNGAEGRSNPVISRCYFLANVTEEYGAGMYNFGKTGESSPKIVNCLFRNNKADSAGSIYNYGGSFGKSNPTIQNCTFSKNEARVGPCVYNQAADITGTVEPFVSNCVFWDNIAYSGFGLVFQNGHAFPHIQYSLVPHDACAELDHGDDSDATCGDGMIYNQDPLFTDPNNDNFRPLAGSPVIDQGEVPITEGSSKDIDGDDRIGNGQIDMGAFEYFDTMPIEIISETQSGTFCMGDSIILEVNARGENTLVFQWKKDDLDIPNANSSVLILHDVSTSDMASYRCTVSDSTQTISTDNIQIDIYDSYDPGIQLDPNKVAFCGTDNSIEVDLSIAVEGFFPSLNWVLNGDVVAEDIEEWNFEAVDSDTLVVQYEAIYACKENDFFASNELEFTELIELDPSLEIAFSADHYCQDEEVVISANVLEAGDDYNIKWWLNQELFQEGTDQITGIDFEASDEIFAELISFAECVTDTSVSSESISFPIFQYTNPQVDIQTDLDSFCNNENLTFMANVLEVGANPIFRWKLDGEAMGEKQSLTLSNLEVGTHILEVAVLSSDLCPTNSIVLDEMEIDVKDCLINNVNNVLSSNSSVKIWPNPAVNTLSILSENNENKLLNYTIFTSSGVYIGGKNGGELTRKIDISNLNSGCYFIKIQTSNGLNTLPFVVLK